MLLLGLPPRQKRNLLLPPLCMRTLHASFPPAAAVAPISAVLITAAPIAPMSVVLIAAAPPRFRSYVKCVRDSSRRC